MSLKEQILLRQGGRSSTYFDPFSTRAVLAKTGDWDVRYVVVSGQTAKAGKLGEADVDHCRFAMRRYGRKMEPTYLHLKPEVALPELRCAPFRAIIVTETEASTKWRNRVANWLVDGGCLYVIAWGVECEAWHDAVDTANLEKFEYGDIPDDEFIMTTWHANEPLSEAFWFAGNCASHPDVMLDKTTIFHVSEVARETELLEKFKEAQITRDE